MAPHPQVGKCNSTSLWQMIIHHLQQLAPFLTQTWFTNEEDVYQFVLLVFLLTMSMMIFIEKGTFSSGSPLVCVRHNIYTPLRAKFVNIWISCAWTPANILDPRVISEQGTEYEATLVISALVNDFLQKKEKWQSFFYLCMRRPHLKSAVSNGHCGVFLGGFLKGAPMPIYSCGTFQKGASLFDVFKKEYIKSTYGDKGPIRSAKMLGSSSD